MYVQRLCEHLVCQLQPLSVTSKLELLIPEGDDDGPKLELLIPEDDDDGPKLELLIPVGDDDGPKLELLIPEGDDDGPKLELLIPEGDDDGRPDFALLPDIVWVNIMSHLSQSDRGRLGQTCRMLDTSLCQPSLWNTVTITLHSGHNPNNAESLPFVEPASYLPMVERFGAYFKDLTLIYVSSKYAMSRDCREVIQCLTRCCRYEILTLYLTSHARCTVQTDLNILAQLFTNHLKSLTLLGEICFDIRVLLSNDTMSGCLERLNLHWQGGTPSWGLQLMLSVTSQFTQLRALYLQSSMLSDDLIVSLSDQRHAPLQELGIQVTHEIRHPLPHIEASSWIRLRAYSPCLQVHVKVADAIPDDALFGFLIPEMAIASISFIEDSMWADTRSIADRFSSTLRKFVDCTTYNYGHDAELVYMVTKCSHLVHFEYNWALRGDTIRELAGLRGSRWLHFLVNLDNVVDLAGYVSVKQLAADVALITRK